MPNTAPLIPLRSLVLAGFILAAAAARLLPHAWNFTPVEAMALFGGAYFASRWAAFAVPLVALLLSDLVLGFYGLMPVVYGCVALSVVLGFWLRGKVSVLRVGAAGLVGAVVFFLVTNFAVWATAGNVSDHPACSIGLVECYVAALPFFRAQLIGTAVWSLLLFGGYALLSRQLPALNARPAAA